MSDDASITLSLDPKADALLERIAEAAGKDKAQVAAEVLSIWLGATLDRLEGDRAPLEELLQRLGERDGRRDGDA